MASSRGYLFLVLVEEKVWYAVSGTCLRRSLGLPDGELLLYGLVLTFVEPSIHPQGWCPGAGAWCNCVWQSELHFAIYCAIFVQALPALY